MTSLLSLPSIPNNALSAPASVSPALRMRVGSELRRAVGLGRLQAAQVAKACREGDASVAALMASHHALTTHIGIRDNALMTQWQPDGKSAKGLFAWARSLQRAGRITDEEVSALPRKNPITELAALCATATVPRPSSVDASLPPSPEKDPATILWVGHSFLESLDPSNSYRTTEDDTPYIIVETCNNPFHFIPRWVQGDDLQALLSALDALMRADTLGLFAPPSQVPWMVDGWMTETMQDFAHRATWENGRPVITDTMLGEMEEEFSLGFEEVEEGRELVANHVAYMHKLSTFKAWAPGGKQMKNWLRKHANTPVALVVARVIKIASLVEHHMPDRRDLECDGDGDATGVFVVLPSETEIPYLDHSIECYGQSDVPSLRIRPVGKLQNPSGFWATHDAVVMAVNLISDAANAIESLAKVNQRTLRRAA